MSATAIRDFRNLVGGELVDGIDGATRGGFKESGYGKDLSVYALEDYTRVKHAMIKLG